MTYSIYQLYGWDNATIAVCYNATNRCIAIEPEWTIKDAIRSCAGGWPPDSEELTNLLCEFDSYEELLTNYPELLI